MKKNVMNRLIAAALALTMILSSVDWNWGITSEAAGGTITYTDAQLLAENLDLKDEEVKVLQNGVVNENEYSILQPEDVNALIEVDEDNTVVYAKSYEQDNYVWIAEQAEVYANNVLQDSGAMSYSEEDGKSTLDFDCVAKGFSVKVYYSLYVTVSEEEQVKLLNKPHYMVTAYSYMETVRSAVTCLSDVMDDFKEVVEGLEIIVKVENYEEANYFYESEELKEVLADYDNAERSLEWLTEADNREAVDKAIADTYKYALKNLSDEQDNEGYIYKVQNAANTNKETLEMMGKGHLIEKIDGIVDMFGHVALILKSIATASEDPLEGFDASLFNIKGNEGLYLTLDEDVAALAQSGGAKWYSVSDVNAKLKAKEQVELTATVNSIAVTVILQAYAVGLANPLTAQQTLYFGGETPKADIIAAINADTFEQDELSKTLWQSYGVNKTNYYRIENDSELGDVLTEAGTFVIAYSPKDFTVTYEDVDTADVTVPYGTTIKLPKHSDPNKGYKHWVKGDTSVTYTNDAKYTVKGNVTIRSEVTDKTKDVSVNVLVSDKYKEQLGEEWAAIMSSAALTGESITVTYPSKELISEGTYEIIAETKEAYEGAFWVPKTAVVTYTDKSTEPIDFAKDGDVYKAKINDSKTYAQVNVVYELIYEVDNLSELLANPGKLVAEAEKQLSDMKLLKDNESDLALVGNIGMLGSSLQTEEAKTAASNIAKGFVLDKYIEDYPSADTKAQLLYYYDATVNSAIREQIKLLAENMPVVIGDPNFNTALSDLLKLANKTEAEIEDIISKVSEVSGKFEQWQKDVEEGQKFAPRSDMIDTTDAAAYDSLIGAIAACVDNDTDLSANVTYSDITEEVTISYTAENMASLSVKVEIVDSEGNALKETASDVVANYAEVFNKGYSLKEDTATKEAFAAIADQLAYNLGVDRELYTCVAGTYPDTLSKDTVVVYTWEPVEYKVVIDDNEQTVTADKLAVILPRPTGSTVRYDYTIDGKVVPVGYAAEAYSYVFTTEQLKSLFDAEKIYEIKYKKVYVENENIGEIAAALNNALKDAGQQADASFVAYENGEYAALVLRLDALDYNKLTSVLTTVAMELVNHGTIQLGGNNQVMKYVFNNGIYADALADAILDGGFSTERLDDAINTDGSIVNNVPLKEGAAVMDLVSETTADPEKTGGLLMDLNIAFDDEKVVPFYVSLYGSDAKKAAKIDNYINTAEGHLDMVIDDGIVSVNAELEKAHEVMLAAMFAEGKIKPEDFKEPSLVEIVDYIREFCEDSVLKNEDVTAATFANTLKELGVDADLSGYEDAIDPYINMFRSILDEGYVVADNTDGQDKELYKLKLTCPKDFLGKVMNFEGLPIEGGDIVAPVEIRFANCDEEVNYTAAIADIKNASILQKADLTTAQVIKTTNLNTVIVLLDDVNEIIVGAKTYIDLNGHKVGKLTANAQVTVLDSRLGAQTSGTIAEFAGNGAVNILAGVYTQDVTDKIPTDYVQNADGSVSNQLYRIVEDDEGNITIEITDYLTMKDAALGYVNGESTWKNLALDLALDLAFECYSWAGLTIANEAGTKYGIYGINAGDVVELYTSGKVGAVDSVLDMIDCAGITGFVNDFIKEMTDYASMGTAVADGTEIVSYTYTTRPWDVVVQRNEEGNYITGGIVASTDKTIAETRTISVKMADDSKGTVAGLLTEMGNVFDHDKMDINITLESLDYTTDGFQYEGDASATVVADLSKREYVAVIGILVANSLKDGSQAQKDLIDEVNTYLEEGYAHTLVSEIEQYDLSEVVNAVKTARNSSFASIAADLGISDSHVIELGSTYDVVLQGVGALLSKFDVSGGSQSIARFAASEDSEYYEKYFAYEYKNTVKGADIDLTFILAARDPMYYVTFEHEDGTLIYETRVLKGDTIEFPEAPEKEGYEFEGWYYNGQKVTGDIKATKTDSLQYTFVAKYTIKKYTVTFKDYDGTEISSKEYNYGDRLVEPEDPQRDPDNTYTYVFAGWDKDLQYIVKADAVYTAEYNSVWKNYTIKFVDYDGSPISTRTYHYGDTVKVPDDPTREADETYSYTFAGWTPAVTTVKENQTYKATYSTTNVKYTIKFVDYDGKVISSKQYNYNDKVTLPSNPTREADATYTYTFAGWTPTVKRVTGNATYRATYDATYIDYTVKFVDYDGDVISSKTYHYGDSVQVPENPTREADKTYTYKFAGWNKTVAKTVTGNATYKATYDSSYVEYTVKFVDYDGDVISQRTYHYKQKLQLPEDPIRPADEDYVYTFAGWTPEVVKEVVADATYKAVYTKTEISGEGQEGTISPEPEDEEKPVVPDSTVDPDDLEDEEDTTPSKPEDSEDKEKPEKPGGTIVPEKPISMNLNLSWVGGSYGRYHGIVDEANKLIYIDVPTEGLSQSCFDKYFAIESEGLDKVTYTFSNSSNKLVQTGEKVVIKATAGNSSTITIYTVIVLGDVVLDGGLGDGEVRSNDATVVLKHCVGRVTLTGNALRAARINNTKGVDAGDATVILKKAVENPKYVTWLND